MGIKLQKKKIILGLASLLVVGSFILIYVLIYRHFASNQQTIVEKSESALKFVSVYKEAAVPLSQIPNYQAVKAKYGLQLTPNQEKFLDQNKFLLICLDSTKFLPGINFDQMLVDFDSMGGGSVYDRVPEDTRLITPDIVLHAYHKYFELTLEDLEQKELSYALGDFLVSLHSNLAVAARANSGDLKERYQNLEAQIVLALVLFENKNSAKPDFFETPDQESAYNEQDKIIDSAQNAKRLLTKYSSGLTAELISNIKDDLDNIYTANKIGSSPLFQQYNDDLKTDYTQFTPRSHYNKNSTLRAYFRTMMYLGRSSYFLQKNIGIADTNLLVKQFTVKSDRGIVPFDAWNKIMTITSFYAGQSDDLTYNEWLEFESKILGSNLSDNYLASLTNIHKLTQNLNQLRMPKILSDVIINENILSKTKSDLLRQSLSFRIFGQRFTFDAWELNDLTAGDEKVEIKLPSTPSALFIPAVAGDLQAKNHVEAFLQKDAEFSSSEVKAFLAKLEQKKSDIDKVKKDEWFGSMGSAWLYVLGALTRRFDENYPRYMQAEAFLDKQIQTFLGSYTELKHDTLLYAKQSYAELGGGSEELPLPPVVKGFVEPNMDFWNRLDELLNHTEQFFIKNNLFVDRSPLARLQQFKKIVRFYTDIAKKELQRQKISDDDYEALRTTELSFMAQPFNAGLDEPDENSGKVALVADIHTDALKGKILYEATAKPYLMLAIVANEQTPRIVAGLVYNHYEFKGDIGRRLTDEDWQDWVYNKPDNLPVKNFWYQSLLVK